MEGIRLCHASETVRRALQGGGDEGVYGAAMGEQGKMGQQQSSDKAMANGESATSKAGTEHSQE